MPLHLIKLCVGVDTVDDLERWVSTRKKRQTHVTRQTPRRGEEILAGGSLYWVIKGVVQCRQTVLGLEACERDGVASCRIVLEPKLVRTEPALRRPFQGWRYLTDADAPADLKTGEGGGDLPADLQRKLIELGAW